MTSASYGRSPVPGQVLRATDRDREAAIGVLQSSYTVGRLTKDEHDARVGRALAAQTYAELDQLTYDLPERPGYPDAPVVPAAPRQPVAQIEQAHSRSSAAPECGACPSVPVEALSECCAAPARRS